MIRSPPWASIVLATRRSCQTRARAIASGCRCQSSLEPSTSVKQKVSTPVGSDIGASIPSRRKRYLLGSRGMLRPRAILRERAFLSATRLMRSTRPAPRSTIVPMSFGSLGACVALGTMEGALVALPGPLALERLARVRSPGWALVAPGSLLLGTFGVLALPSLATGLAILAAVATPLLAAIAAVAVVPGSRRAVLLVPLALAMVAMACTGLAQEVAASMLTALGCLTLGAALVRLTPPRALQLGILSMAAIDVLLLAAGIGQPAAALLGDALGGVHPTFHRAELGPITTDYPDLVLAAVLGGIFAGRPIQRRAAVLVAVLAAAYGGLLTIADVVPATVPLVVALVVVEWGPQRTAVAGRLDGRVGGGYGPCGIDQRQDAVEPGDSQYLPDLSVAADDREVKAVLPSHGIDLDE